MPEETPGRAVTTVAENDEPVAAVVHDPALSEQREFVRAAASLALAAVENRELATQVDESMEELRESRTRIQAAADNERRRIERDLHDGAQQRLVALRIRLGLAADVARDDPERSAELLGELGIEAEEALEELRSLAHGVYPSLLADRGLEEALTALGRSAPLSVIVDVHGSRPLPARDRERRLLLLPRVPPEHAQARERLVHADRGLGRGDALRFTFADDGRGFDDASVAGGAGFTNMRDRVAAVGGELRIAAKPGAGTEVSGEDSAPRLVVCARWRARRPLE